jgi:threonine dehydrogenase-like Zn-dependent dehydrogenase
VRGDGKGAGDGFDSAGDADADANGSQVWDEKDDSDAHAAVAIVCFNLGYLPGQGSDKSVVTQTESTLTAVAAAVKALRPGGVLTVVGTYFPFTTFRRLIAHTRLTFFFIVSGYTGHAGGLEETRAVEDFVASLDPKKFVATTHVVLNRVNCPRLIAVHRKIETKRR